MEIFQVPQRKAEDQVESSPEPIPPTPSERIRKSKSPSPSMANGVKRQAVLPERRKKTEQPLFLLRKLKE